MDKVTTKACTNCKQEKALGDFFNHTRTKDGKTPKCKVCHIEGTKAWKSLNKEKTSLYGWKSGLKYRYGITYKQYEAILKEQNGACAICKTAQYDKTTRRLAVDHDHKTGRVRGLLCNTCNRGLGNMQENVIILESTIAYLKHYE